MKSLRNLPLYLGALAASLAAQQQPKPPTFSSDVLWEPDIEYSNIARVAMDVVQPRASGPPRPAIVMVHGGGFRAGNRQSYLPLAGRLAQRGYVAATVTYRLSPANQFPAPVHDVKAAVRFLRAHATRFGIDPDRIGAVGGSAGGHLVLFLGLTGGVPELEGPGPNLEFSSKVQCVVDYYGPTDFTKSYGKSVDAADVLPLFLGGDLEHARAAHIKSSPLNWVTPNAAPVLAIHGTKDRYVEYAQSTWLIERLRAAGVEAELETLEGADHGFRGEFAERAETRMMAYFDKHLAPVKPRYIVLAANHGSGAEVFAMEWPNGKVLWRVPNQHGHDVQPLPGGHVLYTIGAARRAVEMDRNRQVVWEYGAAEGLEHPISAQRLANGNTLIGDARLGKVIEVDRANQVVWKYESPDLANMRMRNSRRTEQGTTLIAVEAAGKIIEVDASGKIVWTFEAQGGPKRRPYQAHRLANGHTIISLNDPGEVIEVEPSGKIVRSVAGASMDVRFGWASGTQPLPGGGLIVSDYTGKRLVELDAQWRVVHELRDPMWGIASVAVIPAP